MYPLDASQEGTRVDALFCQRDGLLRNSLEGFFSQTYARATLYAVKQSGFQDAIMHSRSSNDRVAFSGR